MQNNYYYPFTFYQEIYAPITDNMVPGIDANRYLVSNYGKVFDLNRNCYLTIHNVYAGYQSVTLHTNHGKKHMLLHRLVGMAFIPGDWSLQINHKNGIKSNCEETNLEWMTARENLMHALDTGLHKVMEDKPNSILTNEQVRIICEELCKRTMITDILKLIGLENTPKNRDLIIDVKRRKTFTRISMNYDFSSDVLMDREFDHDTVVKICKIFEANPNISYGEVFNAVGLQASDQKQRRSLLNKIGSIKLRKAYTDVSKHYKW